MSLTRSELEKIATLAKLELPDDGGTELAAKLSGIIDFFAQLNAVDTDGVAPMAHPLNMSQRLRPDVVTESSHRDKYQQQSAMIQDGLYLVPRVIE